MPVVPWDGEPVFGGKTLVISGNAFRGMAKRIVKQKTGDIPDVTADNDAIPRKTD